MTARMWSTKARRVGVGASDVEDRGYGVGAAAALEASERRRAVRAVASMSTDAEDCARLLAQLGLEPSEGVSSVERAS